MKKNPIRALDKKASESHLIKNSLIFLAVTWSSEISQPKRS